MKTLITGFAMMLALTGAAWAQEDGDLRAYVAEACAEDKARFCSQVTPGNQDRMLACAYAHEDKLSGKCSYALYQAASILEQTAAALGYLAESCMDDVEKFCADVKMGEGRILSCLDNNADKLSEACTNAIDETVEMATGAE